VKILAAIVTYNRCELLGRCLDNLLAQTRPPDAVLVVNNASTDGTVAMLTARGIRFVTQDNLGSAGGWHRAIAHALDHGCDAIWLMDDDGYPDHAALAALEAAAVPGVACASSIVVMEDAPERFVFPFPVLNAAEFPAVFAWPRKLGEVRQLAERAPQGTYPFAHLFNGALIRLDAVRAVGNVDPGFFMFGDEVDYFHRLRGAGAVISVLAARHYHPDVGGRPYTLAKVYYYVKNTLILNRRYPDLAWLRNLATPLVALVRTARRNGLPMALSLAVGPQSRVFYTAIARGLRGEVGKDFDG
jgi:GT2 family glycosyltransferase